MNIRQTIKSEDVFHREWNLRFIQRLTKRAGDLGYAPRFLAFFVALGFFRFDGESPLPPQAPNASR